MDIELKTYGDLKKLIKSIITGQKKDKLINKGKSLALDQFLGLIPGASNAKTAYDFIHTAISKPDTKKTNTWLDKLDVDDNMSKIIDNAVENSFMLAMSKAIEAESDTKPLEQDFNMNQKLVDYLRNSYQGRTITGIKENKMDKETLKQLIIEEIAKLKQEVTLPANQPAVKQTAAAKQYATATKTATAVGTKAGQIKSINDLPGAFETWFGSLGIKDQKGVSQSLILMKIKDTLNKMGIK